MLTTSSAETSKIVGGSFETTPLAQLADGSRHSGISHGKKSRSDLFWRETRLTILFRDVENVGGLYTVRLLIGLFEAGLIPCINVYLSMVYKKGERGKRSSVIFAFSAFASAFGGLLAYGLNQIQSGGYLTGWRILFLCEGLLTIAVVPLFFFRFPKAPQTTWFLSDEEKRMMSDRYQQSSHWGIDEKFSWGEIIKVLNDPKWYAL